MTQVGAAPWQNVKRRTVRAEINPLDKSTIVSVYPVKVREVKHTIQPGVFEIEPGTYDNPSILVVGPSSWWRELSDDEPLLEIPQSSILIADSVVKDYANGLLECNMGDRMPGLFFVPGCKQDANGKPNILATKEWIKKDHVASLNLAKVKQTNWYKALIEMADILWARSNGNPLSISNDMRIAARELVLKKDWDQDFARMEMIPCRACGTRNHAGVVVCPNCKVVLDQVKFKELGLTFAS